MSSNYNIALDCLIAMTAYALPKQELKHIFITKDEAFELCKETIFSFKDIEFIFSIQE